MLPAATSNPGSAIKRSADAATASAENSSGVKPESGADACAAGRIHELVGTLRQDQ